MFKGKQSFIEISRFLWVLLAYPTILGETVLLFSMPTRRKVGTFVITSFRGWVSSERQHRESPVERTAGINGQLPQVLASNAQESFGSLNSGEFMEGIRNTCPSDIIQRSDNSKVTKQITAHLYNGTLLKLRCKYTVIWKHDTWLFKRIL